MKTETLKEITIDGINFTIQRVASIQDYGWDVVELLVNGNVYEINDGAEIVMEELDTDLFNQDEIDAIIEEHDLSPLHQGWGMLEELREEEALDNKAEEGDEDVSIAIVRHYYETGKSVELMTDDLCEIVMFDTYADAKKHVDEMESEVYVTRHNEITRPDYIIIK